MKYKFFKNHKTGVLTAVFYDKEYREFGGWFWYETAADEIHDIVMKYIKDNRVDEYIIHGSEYVTYLSKDGIFIRPMEAFEPDLNSDEFPESKKMSLDTIQKLIIEWREREMRQNVSV